MLLPGDQRQPQAEPQKARPRRAQNHGPEVGDGVPGSPWVPPAPLRVPPGPLPFPRSALGARPSQGPRTARGEPSHPGHTPRTRSPGTARSPPTSLQAASAHGPESQKLKRSRWFRDCHYFIGAVSQPTLERKSETPPKGWTLREGKKKVVLS
jgi:hypothetical protein